SVTSASVKPGASALRSIAATRSPSSLARRIARRWCRPAPTKRTVFIRRRLLPRRDRVPQQAEHGLDVDGEAGARLHRDAVGDQAEEPADVLERQVVAHLALRLQALQVVVRALLELRVPRLPALAERRVGA